MTDEHDLEEEGIAECREIAARHGCQAVVILRVERGGDVRISTWGETRPKCNAIGKWAQGLWSYAVTKVPFQTTFGWGNGGKPLPLTPEERAQCTEMQLAWGDTIEDGPET